MIEYTCDYCGEPINGNDEKVTIEAHGCERSGPNRSQRINCYIGHYHANDANRNCFRKVTDAIELAEGAGRSLENIPVTSNHKVAAMRRKHRRPEA